MTTFIKAKGSLSDKEISGLAIELTSKLSDCLIEGRYQFAMMSIHAHLLEVFGGEDE